MTFDPTNMACDPKFKGHQKYSPQSECGAAGLVPEVSLYRQAAYITSAITMASSSSQVPPVITQESPYLYPGPCHKYSTSTMGTGTMGTSTVITHTGSTLSLLGQEPRLHDCPGMAGSGSGFPPAACALQGYPPGTIAAAPPHTSLPCPNLSHFFSVPQQPSVPANRGKHKRKSEGARGAGSVATAPIPPQHTSCLAKLLSASTQERMWAFFIWGFLFG